MGFSSKRSVLFTSGLTHWGEKGFLEPKSTLAGLNGAEIQGSAGRSLRVSVWRASKNEALSRDREQVQKEIAREDCI